MRCTFYILIILFMAACSFMVSCATTSGARATPEMLEYEHIIDVSDTSKDELYLRVNSWFVKAFKSAESVIEFQDKEAGRVMGKYTFKYSDAGNPTYMRSTITIDVKDNKVRIRCQDPLFMRVDWDSDFKPVTKEGGAKIAQEQWAMLTQDLIGSVFETDSNW